MAKKIIIIVIILILIALVLFFLFGQRKTPVTPPQGGEPRSDRGRSGNQPPTNQEIAQPRELTPAEKLAMAKNELVLKARNFVERYGSYSTDAQFANLIELKNEMSDKLWRETEKYINQKEKSFDEGHSAELSRSLQDKEFYSVTTKVLNISEKDFLSDKVLYLVSTQRQEIKGTTPKVFYQNTELTMAKENGGWKVDQVTWK